MSGPLSRFVTISDEGTTGAFNLDPSIAPFNAVVQVYVADNVTADYSIEFTLDDLNLASGKANLDVRWTTTTEFPAASTGTITASLTFPVSAVRVVVATLTGGSIELKILQGFSIN